jgi:hypothetical protein
VIKRRLNHHILLLIKKGRPQPKLDSANSKGKNFSADYFFILEQQKLIDEPIARLRHINNDNSQI